MKVGTPGACCTVIDGDAANGGARVIALRRRGDGGERERCRARRATLRNRQRNRGDRAVRDGGCHRLRVDDDVGFRSASIEKPAATPCWREDWRAERYTRGRRDGELRRGHAGARRSGQTDGQAGGATRAHRSGAGESYDGSGLRSRDPGADQEGKRFEPQRHRCFEFLHFARDFGTYEGWVPQKTRAKRPRGMQSR